MQFPAGLMRLVCRAGSYMVYGTTEEAEWIFEKIQWPSSYVTVAMNLLYWRLGRPRIRGVVALMVEPICDCNLRCSYCPWTVATDRMQGIRPRMMTWDTFCASVDSAPKTVETIQLCGIGEPTMHPQLCEMIEYIAAAKRRPSLFTNGTLLKGEFLERLAKTPLDVLNVSFEPDAATAKEYRGVDYESVRENVQKFLSLKQPETAVKIRMVAHPGNADLLRKGAEYWQELGHHVKVGPLFKLEGERSNFKCMEPWRGNLMIWTDGKVSPCSIDCFEDLVIGDVNEEALSGIAKSESYRQLLARFVSGNVVARCAVCADAKLDGVPSLTPRMPSQRK